MKNFAQYHNTEKQGQPSATAGNFSIHAKKPIHHVDGQRVWLISGEGKTSPKSYHLRYVFEVNRVAAGTPNRAYGSQGTLFTTPIPLNHLSWFKGFLDSQQNFSLGIREIPDPYLAEFERLIATSTP